MLRTLPRSQFARLTQIDYDREMRFIATAKDDNGSPETLGMVRVIADPDNVRAQFDIVAGAEVRRRGLGALLMGKVVRYCRERGTKELYGEIVRENQGMLALARRWGFQQHLDARTGSYELRLPLQWA